MTCDTLPIKSVDENIRRRLADCNENGSVRMLFQNDIRQERIKFDRNFRLALKITRIQHSDECRVSRTTAKTVQLF